jgi:putative transposase
VKYACIAQHEGLLPTRLLCELLDVSPAGYYAAQHREPSARARSDERLRVTIRAAHAASHRRYGRPKLPEELRNQGWRCGHNRLARLMRLDGVRAKRVKKFRVTTESQHAHAIAPNRLARRFAPTAYERDQAWAADITYLPTGEGWLYLAVVLDLASRRAIGWCTSSRLDQQLTLEALRRALTFRRPSPGVLHHSDRGAQYACAAYQRVLADHGVRCSMSRPGACWDNAVVESFFATLKTELVADAHWATRAEAHRQLVSFIDVWYNHQRRHASLGYRSPVEYERTLTQLRTA